MMDTSGEFGNLKHYVRVRAFSDLEQIRIFFLGFYKVSN